MNYINKIFIPMKEILKIYLVVEIILVIIWMKKMKMVELELHLPHNLTTHLNQLDNYNNYPKHPKPKIYKYTNIIKIKNPSYSTSLGFPQLKQYFSAFIYTRLSPLILELFTSDNI